MDIEKTVFPRNFYWGASTASHQVEGNTYNQWTVWELENAKRLAHKSEQRWSWLANWQEIKPYAENPENYVSGTGVEHYKRYKEDMALLKRLNFNAFRFGIEWSRIEPEEGVWDEKEVQHYKEYIAELTSLGVEPFLNIWHWTMPVWFTQKGGFGRRSNLKYFIRFVEKIIEEYGNELNYIITFNEPNVYTSLSYVTGDWPPQKKNLLKGFWVYYNLATAHRRSYKLIKSRKKHIQVGVAAQLANIQAKRQHNFFDQLSTKWMRIAWNWWFLKRISRHQDFLGINYYFTDYYTSMFKRQNPKVPLNDLGWYMEPEGLYPLLLRTWIRFKKPIIVTENGTADANDSFRQWWLEETIVAMERAISEGVDLRGYFHWSLLDNFEWSSGWWPKFGLVEVDRKTMKRTVRPSAKWFASRLAKIRAD